MSFSKVATSFYNSPQMKIQEIIGMVDVLRPNAIPEEIKIGWLAALDGTLRSTVVALHEAAGVPQIGTGADLDPSPAATLLAQQPHHIIYQYWLCAQIDFSMGEIARYSNSMALYNAALESFAAAYKMGHLPLARGQFQL